MSTSPRKKVTSHFETKDFTKLSTYNHVQAGNAAGQRTFSESVVEMLEPNFSSSEDGNF